LERRRTKRTKFRQRVKAFDVISTGDHAAVSVQDIGDVEEQDFRSVYGRWMVEVWGLIIIEMALVVHANVIRFLY
jgi:hypothetical protein